MNILINIFYIINYSLNFTIFYFFIYILLVMGVSTLVAVTLINALGVIIYSISAFGNAIVFHIGWQICYIISPDTCNGSKF